jgi:hypothetical protein
MFQVTKVRGVSRADPVFVARPQSTNYEASMSARMVARKPKWEKLVFGGGNGAEEAQNISDETRRFLALEARPKPTDSAKPSNLQPAAPVDQTRA